MKMRVWVAMLTAALAAALGGVFAIFHVDLPVPPFGIFGLLGLAVLCGTVDALLRRKRI